MEGDRWLTLLDEEDLAFLKRFVLASGSLKELAQAYEISYPTVRLRLDRLIAKIKVFDSQRRMSHFERTARGLYAEGRIDMPTLKTLLSAHHHETEQSNANLDPAGGPAAAVRGLDAAPAETVLREIPWEGGQRRVVGEEAKLTTHKVLELDQPQITATYYELRGQVEYEQVEGVGYLEMWSWFPDGQRYFSRTLETDGPMGRFTGSSGRREFSLPFRSTSGIFPTKLVVNVVLPGKGTVVLSPLKLIQIDRPVMKAGWWDPRAGGWVGGILGSCLGLLGGLIGLLCTWPATRRAAVALAAVATVPCVLLLAAGLAALGARQPYHVWYPLLLCGVIGTFVLGGCIVVIRRRSAEFELRKMSAMDASM